MTAFRTPPRYDYAVPLRISASQRQAERADYTRHVAELVRQVLLTDQGERVCVPEFGCGMRHLVFEPITAALRTTVELTVRQALDKYLGGVIQVRGVSVSDASPVDEAAIDINIEYTIIETQTNESLVIEVPGYGGQQEPTP
jgi:phage baseplate assembly protein W